MKSLLMAVTLLASVSASAARITDARFNNVTGKIEVDVAYSGCSEREFKLEIGTCMETDPVKCDARLVDVSGRSQELCQAFFEHTVEVTLDEAGLNDEYFSGASIYIQGGMTNAIVRLPR